MTDYITITVEVPATAIDWRDCEHFGLLGAVLKGRGSETYTVLDFEDRQAALAAMDKETAYRRELRREQELRFLASQENAEDITEAKRTLDRLAAEHRRRKVRFAPDPEIVKEAYEEHMNDPVSKRRA